MSSGDGKSRALEASQRVSFCLTAATAALLAFVLQPLVGKIAAAHLGAVASVWGVCLLFFQLSLLVGYLIAFGVSKLRPGLQFAVYPVLLLLSLVSLRMPTAQHWASVDVHNPVLGLTLVLAVTVGIPCALLYSISGTMQTWCAHAGWRNPYLLYSVSNIASVGGLLAYPLLIEPNLSVAASTKAWMWGYEAVVAFGLLTSLFMLVRLWRKPKNSDDSALSENPSSLVSTESAAVPTVATAETSTSVEPSVAPAETVAVSAETVATPAETFAAPSGKDYLVWILFSAMGCVTLIAYSAYLTADIAPVPLLWTLPLCLYLISFIICFASEKFYYRPLFALLAPALWIAEPICRRSLVADAVVTLLIVFCFSIVCTGELARRKPHHNHLTAFYLAIAVGGAIGGVFENIFAPFLFTSNVEPLLLAFFMIGVSWSWALSVKHGKSQKSHGLRLLTLVLLSTMTFVMISVGWLQYGPRKHVVAEFRNFYGCLKVIDRPGFVELLSGSTVHGVQRKDRKTEPTLYYSSRSACPLIFPVVRSSAGDAPIKVGVIGLGTGSLATYGQSGDTFDFYELDPKVENVARKYFSFLQDSKAKINIVLGDARKSLEDQKTSPQYDLLVIDAFNGDAVPTHLLTREAFELFLKQVKQGGMLVFHCTNEYLNLSSVIANIAHSLGLTAFEAKSESSTYLLISLDPKVQNELPQLAARYSPLVHFEPATMSDRIGVWSDDFINVPAALDIRPAHKRKFETYY